jgi:hypothetical protein
MPNASNNPYYLVTFVRATRRRPDEKTVRKHGLRQALIVGDCIEPVDNS